MQQEINQLDEENRQLQESVQSLKSDPAAIERIAREEMGLARPGEYIFKIRADDSGNATTLNSPASQPSQKPLTGRLRNRSSSIGNFAGLRLADATAPPQPRHNLGALSLPARSRHRQQHHRHENHQQADTSRRNRLRAFFRIENRP